MDGTRIIRAVELYRNEYLVGEEFPADVWCYPTESQTGPQSPLFYQCKRITGMQQRHIV